MTFFSEYNHTELHDNENVQDDGEHDDEKDQPHGVQRINNIWLISKNELWLS